MNLKVTIAIFLLATLAGCKSSQPPAAAAAQQPASAAPAQPHIDPGTPTGKFDFYLLNLSWSPEFCHSHADSPECSAHLGFVVHGMWPQNNDGTYPENCTDAPGPPNPAGYTDVIPTASLVEHEWSTHGTCTGLAPDTYFKDIRAAFHSVQMPANFGKTASMEAPRTILAQFQLANPSFPAASFALSCGHNYLTAVEVCLDKSLHPEACQLVRTCRANNVKITPR